MKQSQDSGRWCTDIEYQDVVHFGIEAGSQDIFVRITRILPNKEMALSIVIFGQQICSSLQKKTIQANRHVHSTCTRKAYEVGLLMHSVISITHL